jgi:hypothetical protein
MHTQRHGALPDTHMEIMAAAVTAVCRDMATSAHLFACWGIVSHALVHIGRTRDMMSGMTAVCRDMGHNVRTFSSLRIVLE